MTYPQINGTLVGNDVMQIFVYANSVTFGLFGTFMVVAFFVVSLLGTMFGQQRITGRINPSVSFLAASFVTLIFAVLLAQTEGIIQPTIFYFLVAANILSLMWVALAQD